MLSQLMAMIIMIMSIHLGYADFMIHTVTTTTPTTTPVHTTMTPVHGISELVLVLAMVMVLVLDWVTGTMILGITRITDMAILITDMVIRIMDMVILITDIVVVMAITMGIMVMQITDTLNMVIADRSAIQVLQAEEM